MRWTTYAQSLSDRPVKGMLTGPVTVLPWSFVRDDQPLADTARQVALALCEEVNGLEATGTSVIQVDEPALRETLTSSAWRPPAPTCRSPADSRARLPARGRTRRVRHPLPRAPSAEETAELLRSSLRAIPAERLWVNPDCGLKTRGWPETRASLENLVTAARTVRGEVS